MKTNKLAAGALALALGLGAIAPSYAAASDDFNNAINNLYSEESGVKAKESLDKIKKLNEDIARYRKQLEERKPELAAAEAELKAAKAKLAEAEATYSSEIKALQAEKAQLEENIKKAKSDDEGKKDEPKGNKDLTAEQVAGVQANIDKLEEQIAEYVRLKDEKAAKAKLAEAEATYSSEIKALQAEKAQLEENIKKAKSDDEGKKDEPKGNKDLTAEQVAGVQANIDKLEEQIAEYVRLKDEKAKIAKQQYITAMGKVNTAYGQIKALNDKITKAIGDIEVALADFQKDSKAKDVNAIKKLLEGVKSELPATPQAPAKNKAEVLARAEKAYTEARETAKAVEILKEAAPAVYKNHKAPIDAYLTKANAVISKLGKLLGKNVAVSDILFSKAYADEANLDEIENATKDAEEVTKEGKDLLKDVNKKRRSKTIYRRQKRRQKRR